MTCVRSPRLCRRLSPSEPCRKPEIDDNGNPEQDQKHRQAEDEHRDGPDSEVEMEHDEPDELRSSGDRHEHATTDDQAATQTVRLRRCELRGDVRRRRELDTRVTALERPLDSVELCRNRVFVGPTKPHLEGDLPAAAAMRDQKRPLIRS
ncbi:hypothetical protein [Frondihabitans sucicola]|uniref:hypothetical protein n=1 Tax=Frondihabitans sucicola TaxID=1268041 RepID=UPI0025739052|nr:hypothetical protein [Frondihabitans sucicola]